MMAFESSKKAMAIIVLSFVLGMLGCASGEIESQREVPTHTERQSRLVNSSPNDVIVVAHRGCWNDTAENSYLAVTTCINAGVDMVELDVRRSKDGVLILMHDETVDRTTNGTGKVSSLTLDEILELRLRVKSGGPQARITDLPVPLLEDILLEFRDRVLINVDCKADVYDDVVKVLRRTRTESQVLLKTSAMPGDWALRNAPFHGLTHYMPVIRSSMGALDKLVPMYARYDPVAYELVFDNLEYFEAGIETLAASGERIWVNTMLPRYSGGLDDQLALRDPNAAWGRLLEMGVNMIQTDFPIELVEYLEQRENVSVGKALSDQNL